MKKYLIGALLTCALITPAFGQGVTCDTCYHQMSLYYGEGGVVAEVDGDAEMVNWLATCGNVTRTGELTPNEDGVVSMLLEGDLACMSTDMEGNANGHFEIGPITDGGWFYITLDDNSAVGNLISKDILENAATEITDSGENTTMTMGSGAVLLKEPATGRVGLLPTILPVPEMEIEPETKCGWKGAGTGDRRTMTECLLGDGGTEIRVQAPGDHGVIGDTNRVVRPYGSQTITFTADLWGNKSGHYGATVGEADLGHPKGTAFTANFTATLESNSPGVVPSPIDATGVAGVATTTDGSTATVQAWTVSANGDYCGTADKPLNNVATINITATMTDTNAGLVVPTVVDTDDDTAETQTGMAKVMIVCPSSAASANMGQELVPDNLFPTDR